MQNLIKNYLNGAIFSSVSAIVLGILFFVFPETSLDVIRWIIAILAFVAGAALIISELTKKSGTPYFGATALGAILIVIGLVFATNQTAINIFAIVLGAWFIVTAVGGARYSFALTGSAIYVSGLTTLVSLVVGILLIVNPWGGSISMMVLLGASLIIFGIASAVNTLVLKNNLKDVAKKLGLKK